MDRGNQYDFIIIGGGVAGLSAANALAERRAKVVLIEAGTYPAHKVCGEFFSPECVPMLEEWGLEISSRIHRARFIAGNRSFTFEFPQPAVGLSRFCFDQALAQRAESKDAVVMTGTRVEDWKTADETSGGAIEVLLSTGETLTGQSLLIGTGRVLASKISRKPPDMPFLGFKAHFEGVDMQETLEMYLGPKAYLGLSNVAPNRANLACIAEVEGGASPAETMRDLMPMALKEKLAAAKMVFPEWMAMKAPRFDLQDVPDWDRVFFIGDAAGSIFPATGDGLAMGLSSGLMVADYALAGDASGFRRAWLKRYQARIKWGKFLHGVLMNPVTAGRAMTACRWFPGLAAWLFGKTREKVIY